MGRISSAGPFWAYLRFSHEVQPKCPVVYDPLGDMGECTKSHTEQVPAMSSWIGMFTGGTIWLLTHGHMVPAKPRFLGPEDEDVSPGELWQAVQQFPHTSSAAWRSLWEIGCGAAGSPPPPPCFDTPIGCLQRDTNPGHVCGWCRFSGAGELKSPFFGVCMT